jgi:flotillin
MIPTVVGVVLIVAISTLIGFFNLIQNCPPNLVLIFTGKKRMVGGRQVGYRVVKNGLTWRLPFVERVDSMELSNMIIELQAANAYAKGGVPVNVQGVANVKVASHEPLLNNAIERFLGKNQLEISAIAKATLEGSLRGVLSTLTPEQLNEDRSLFQERLVAEVEQDMSALGLVVDTLKIQNIFDDVKYLDSIGRTRNAELLSSARIAEALARADALVNAANNNEREVEAQILAQTEVAKADAARALADIQSRRAAVVAEENAAVAALVAQARAEVEVQKARIDQVRSKLEADVIAPAKANCEAMEQQAKATVAPIIEDGKARADALEQLSASWLKAGDQARQIFLMQKIEPLINQITDTISSTKIDKITVIDTQGSRGSSGSNPANLMMLAEQAKAVFGIDVVAKLQEMTTTSGSSKMVDHHPEIIEAEVAPSKPPVLE